MSTTPQTIGRILVIDDEKAVHEAYRAILAPRASTHDVIDAMDAALFGDGVQTPTGPAIGFELDIASQGKAGVELLKHAFEQGQAYSMAFVDMRMPPGWDGIHTIEQLWRIDPELDVVICTAYSDHPWEHVAKQLGQTHRLLLLRKPFEAAEVWQLACSLTQKRLAEHAAKAARLALETSNARLKLEIEARQNMEGQLKYDSLTSLPNRLLLHERVERCIERAKRDGTFQYAVLFMDLDDFKAINDGFGHAIGDFVLVEVGKRLKGCLRSLDTALRAGGDIPARLGGDEFVLLLDGVRNADEVQLVAARIQASMAEPVRVAGQELRISVSIGFTLGSPDHAVPDDALRDADAALYQAKEEGKARVHAFDEAVRKKVMTERRLSAELPHAIKLDQMRVMYQPITSLESGELESFEALLRWQHPELGAISPAIFIPVAEETGAIRDIGLWVMRESCRQLRIWHEQFPDRPDLAVSVNVSCKQLVDPHFVVAVEQILGEVGLPGKCLNIEITESVFIQNVETTCTQLKQIRALGIGLHLDDFGTGYSSLSSFHQLPIDAVKIDRSFVANMGIDGRVANIVQAIQAMANNRSLKVIAEGIETMEQLVQLQALGCTCGQGYFMSRPVDAIAALALLRNNDHAQRNRDATWPQDKAA